MKPPLGPGAVGDGNINPARGLGINVIPNVLKFITREVTNHMIKTQIYRNQKDMLHSEILSPPNLIAI